MRKAVGVLGGLKDEVQVTDDCLWAARCQIALQRVDLLDVLPVLLGLTCGGRMVQATRVLQSLGMLLHQDPVVVQGLLVLRLTLPSPGCVLRRSEDPTQRRRSFHREVLLPRRRRRRSDHERVEHGGRRSLLEGFEVQMVVDSERRGQHALQNLDLLLDLGC